MARSRLATFPTCSVSRVKLCVLVGFVAPSGTAAALFVHVASFTYVTTEAAVRVA